MELLQLRYFIELAQSEHLTNTAKNLRISAPSLSLTISKLENELGVPLFDRVGRNIKLNEYGKIFYKYTNKGLLSIDSGRKEIQALLENKSTIDLAVSSPLTWEKCFNDFKKQYKQISLNIHIICENEPLSYEDWHFDFYLGITREIDKNFFQFQKLLKEEMPVIILSKNHPLSSAKQLDLREFKEETFISLGNTNPTAHKYLLDLCNLADFNPKNIIEADYFTRLKYLEENKGVVLTTELGCSNNVIRSNAFSIIPLSFPILTRQQAIAWPKDTEISTAGNIFRSFITQFCKENQFTR